jgi:hypothetical protein
MPVALGWLKRPAALLNFVSPRPVEAGSGRLLNGTVFALAKSPGYLNLNRAGNGKPSP